MQPDLKKLLLGDEGEARRNAAKVITEFASKVGASSFVAIKHAHLVGCYWSGQANINLLDSWITQGAKFRVPTTLNATSACLLMPSPSPRDEQRKAKDSVAPLVEMGAQPTLTCAPYHLPLDLRWGDKVAWAESNAVVYANSVLGVRTNKTPQYLDMMAALCGYMPRYGLYDQVKRQPVTAIRAEKKALSTSMDYQLFGLWVGYQMKSAIPIIYSEYLPTPDQLRAFGANANATGDLAMFHWDGVTPESRQYNKHDLPALLFTKEEKNHISKLFQGDKRQCQQIRVGTPHASVPELRKIIELFRDKNKRARIPFIVSTSRFNKSLIEEQYQESVFEQFNITLVLDACTYYDGPLPQINQHTTIGTNSGKWAFYARSNLRVKPILLSLEDCVNTATGVRID